MADTINLIIASFACYRITQLLVYDRGPFSIFEQLRKWTAQIALEHRVFNGLAFMLTCPYCTGVWVAGLCGVLLTWPTVAGDLFLLIFGLAGLQSVIERHNV